MPMWTIHHTPGIFTDAAKDALAADITEHYYAIGLPRFYVVTLFNEIDTTDFYVGGRRADAAVRIAIDHIARRNPDEDSRRRTARWVTDMIAPHLADHLDLHWEYHIDETSDQLWMINGLVPPPAGSDAEVEWARTGRAAAY